MMPGEDFTVQGDVELVLDEQSAARVLDQAQQMIGGGGGSGAAGKAGATKPPPLPRTAEPRNNPFGALLGRFLPGGSGLAGIGGTAGAAGAVGGAFAVGAVALGVSRALYAWAGGTLSKALDHAQYSPQLSQVALRMEVFDRLLAIQRGQQLGPALNNFVGANYQFKSSWQRLTAPVESSLLNTVSRTLQQLSAITDIVPGGSSSFWDAIFIYLKSWLATALGGSLLGAGSMLTDLLQINKNQLAEQKRIRDEMARAIAEANQQAVIPMMETISRSAHPVPLPNFPVYKPNTTNP